MKQAEEAFSNFIFMEFSACIVTSVFGFFFGLLIVGAIFGSSFQIIPFMFGVFPGFLGILRYFYKIFFNFHFKSGLFFKSPDQGVERGTSPIN